MSLQPLCVAGYHLKSGITLNREKEISQSKLALDLSNVADLKLSPDRTN